MVQEICRDIKKLDFAKKNLTTTVLSLRRISMLATAVDQLESLATKRDYRDAAGLFQAVGQLNEHLEKFGSISRVVDLRNRFQQIKMLFRSHIFEDFATLFAMSADSNLANGSEFKAQYEDACTVVDGMGGQVRDELIASICNRELSQYTKIFSTTGDTAKVDRIERRYAWLKKMLKDKSLQLEIFPRGWCVQERLCTSFCKMTKAQLASILDSAEGGGGDTADVTALQGALKGTLQFEKDLEERFGAAAAGGRGASLDSDEEEEEDGAAAAVRRKYEARRRERRAAESSGGAEDAAGAERPAYKGLISRVFDGHLRPYVTLERQTLMDTMGSLVDGETWEVEDGDETKVLQSAPQLFNHIKRSLKRCSALTRGETLASLMRVFQDVLRAYAARLEGKLPKLGASTSALQGGDWQVRVTEPEEAVICLIVNTAAYCFETVGQLSENVEKLLAGAAGEGEEAPAISVDGEEDAFSAVMTRSLSTLVLGMETNMEAVLKAMLKEDFGAMESVGDQSDFVGLFTSAINGTVPGISKILGGNDFRFVCDKFGASFPIRYTRNIFKCRRINETGAQQLLLDTHALKTTLLELPAMGGLDASRSGYGKGIAREMAKAEALLKVIQSPPEHAGAMYKALLPEGSVAEFQAVLELKGLKKAEQQPLVDQLTGKVGVKPAAEAAAGAGAGAGARAAGRGKKPAGLGESRIASQMAMSGRSMMQNTNKMMLQTSNSFKRVGASVSKLGGLGGGGGEDGNGAAVEGGSGAAMRKGFTKFSKHSTQFFSKNLFSHNKSSSSSSSS